MAKTGKLTARAAATTKAGRYGDGGGLYLVVSETGARKWVFRFSFARRVTEMGMGSAEGKPTFGQCADSYIEAKSPEWRNANMPRNGG